MNTYLKSNIYRFIIYPDSTLGFDAVTVCANIKIALNGQYAYCLHDQDVWTEEDDEFDDSKYSIGELKKPHYHFVVRFVSNITTTRLKYAIGYNCKLYVGMPYGQTENDFFRYLLHLDHPNKFQYPRDSIKSNMSKSSLNELLKPSNHIYISPEELELHNISLWIHGVLSTSRLLDLHPHLVYKWTSLSSCKKSVNEEIAQSYQNQPHIFHPKSQLPEDDVQEISQLLVDTLHYQELNDTKIIL